MTKVTSSGIERARLISVLGLLTAVATAMRPKAKRSNSAKP